MAQKFVPSTVIPSMMIGSEGVICCEVTITDLSL
ncbi:uncharacterized protein METZ01_LOCUS250943 [marine metagenome]|uniref:Uncharacterized protein n=1 Tax=marine metagenome TaxID=408172 RepID=A0A382IFJ7_9ZZZZ